MTDEYGERFRGARAACASADAGRRGSDATVAASPVFRRRAPGLDACLAALERTLPDGAPVLIADDACARSARRADWRAAGAIAAASARATCAATARSASPATSTRRFADDRRRRPGAAALRRRAPRRLAAATGATRRPAGKTARRHRSRPGSARTNCSAVSPRTTRAGFPEPIAEAAASAGLADAARTLPAAAGPACSCAARRCARSAAWTPPAFRGWGALDDCAGAPQRWAGATCCARPPSWCTCRRRADGGAALGEIERLQSRWPDLPGAAWRASSSPIRCGPCAIACARASTELAAQRAAARPVQLTMEDRISNRGISFQGKPIGSAAAHSAVRRRRGRGHLPTPRAPSRRCLELLLDFVGGGAAGGGRQRLQRRHAGGAGAVREGASATSRWCAIPTTAASPPPATRARARWPRPGSPSSIPTASSTRDTLARLVRHGVRGPAPACSAST